MSLVSLFLKVNLLLAYTFVNNELLKVTVSQLLVNNNLIMIIEGLYCRH